MTLGRDGRFGVAVEGNLARQLHDLVRALADVLAKITKVQSQFRGMLLRKHHDWRTSQLKA